MKFIKKSKERKEKSSFDVDMTKQTLRVNVDSWEKGYAYEWTSNWFCTLDIDYHGSCDIEEEDIKKVKPTPAAYQITKRKGATLFYFGSMTRDGELNAVEVASLAYYSAKRLFPSATGIEVLHKFTKYENIKPILQDGDINNLKLISSFSYNEDNIQRYLDENGLHFGDRLTHDRCIFHPTSESNNPSVVVNEYGIRCYRCDKSVSWSYLLSERQSTIDHAVDNFLWFDLAILEFNRLIDEKTNESIIKNAYSALLKLRYGVDDIRIPLALKKIGLYLTTDDLWITDKGEIISNEDLKSYYLSSVPMMYQYWFDMVTVKEKDANGEDVFKIVKKIRPIEKSYCKNRVKNYIYPKGLNIPRIRYIDGHDLARENITEKEREFQHSYYTREIKTHYSKIVEPSKAFDILDLTLKDSLPREAVLTCLFAHAFTELNADRPILLAYGVSGSGKTNLSRICAAIAETSYRVIERQSKNSKDKFKEAFGDAVADNTRFIVADEHLKIKDPELFLSVNNSSVYYRRLYKGNIEIQNNSVLTITGISIPDSFKDNSQFMRRAYILPRFAERKIWQSHNMRDWIRDDEQNQIACDSLLSFVRANMPCSLNDYICFSDFMKDIIKIFPEDCVEPREETPEDITTGISKIENLLDIIVKTCKRHTGGKRLKQYEIDMYSVSEAWEEWNNMFPGANYSYGIPGFISDRFQEQDIKGYRVDLTFASGKIFVAIKHKKGNRLVHID